MLPWLIFVMEFALVSSLGNAMNSQGLHPFEVVQGGAILDGGAHQSLMRIEKRDQHDEASHGKSFVEVSSSSAVAAKKASTRKEHLLIKSRKQDKRCPANFPACHDDGDCVIRSCDSGTAGECVWDRGSNYILGFDDSGDRCTGDYQASQQAPCATSDAVQAVYTGNGNQYPAVIQSISGTSITVNWDDGDTQHRVVDSDNVFKNGVACSSLQAGGSTPTPAPALLCPSDYPVCHSDGDCVITSCSSSCAWERNTNYISGWNNGGDRCTGDYQAPFLMANDAAGDAPLLNGAAGGAGTAAAGGSCEFMNPMEDEYMKCVDGSLCHPVTDPLGMACCRPHAGRLRCPMSKPLMCAYQECDEDYCCDQTCDTFGGLRQCMLCDETLDGFKNDGYRGCQSMTRGGKICQRWDAQLPHAHTMTPSTKPYSDLRENFCRNPDPADDAKLTIWCYTTSHDPVWDFCDPLPEVSHTGPPTCAVALPLLGTKDRPHLADRYITASSYHSNQGTSGFLQMWRSRLENTESTWTAETSDLNPYIQWDLRETHMIMKIQMKGRGDSGNEYIKKFKIGFSADGDTWILDDAEYEGNSDKDTLAEITINTPVWAQMMRVYPTSWNEKISGRFELLGCNGMGSVVISLPGKECCSGNDCEQSTADNAYVTWQHCHDQCDLDPACIGFEYGVDRTDNHDRCTTADLCACWLVKGSCAQQNPHPSYNVYLFEAPNVPMRLNDGAGKENGFGGRVEVYHNGKWGTVCADNFKEIDAEVACKQLGMGGGAIRTADDTPDGEDAMPIWMDDIDCLGSEGNIWQCTFPGWGVHNCEHTADLGLDCTPPPAGPPGYKGMNGVPGLPGHGDPGPPGIKGITGVMGVKGLNGTEGKRGPEGDHNNTVKAETDYSKYATWETLWTAFVVSTSLTMSFFCVFLIKGKLDQEPPPPEPFDARIEGDSSNYDDYGQMPMKY